ncbi:Hypothetical predicted protein [Mytilus galloprovincialis]|uniref:Uncharacterized protein n=1 Tax=Mytilus galloprovincialis TaxID=29158 RepID=A0A8B6ELU6_MYTGA|nr:Hypothetical predicted protein [Mytilus galloprovincialis]
MVKVERGRITISANIILTALVITRGFSFGLIMMSLYIKYGDDILDDDVIKIADLENAASMPLGTAVKSIVFSFIGVFVLELITGVCGMLGVLRHSKTMLSIVSSDYYRDKIEKIN